MTATAEGSAPLVLLVDDTAETRRLMRRVLERQGFRVGEATRGEEAIDEIRGSHPELVILDLRLPGIDGFEVARRIRADPDSTIASTVILACSASVQSEVRLAALAAGCDAFEGKPFEITRLGDRVRGLIAQRRPA